MGIDIRFEPSSNYIDDRIEVYANDVCIGTLSSSEAMPMITTQNIMNYYQIRTLYSIIIH